MKEFLPEQIEEFWFRDIMEQLQMNVQLKLLKKQQEILMLFLYSYLIMDKVFFTTEISGNAFRKQNFSYSGGYTKDTIAGL